MTHQSTMKRALLVAGIGLAAVPANPPAAAILLAIGTAMAVWALFLGKGVARIVPAALLVTVVVGAFYAPVKTIERAKARRLTLPKTTMTVAEMRDPVGHGLQHFFTFGLPCHFPEPKHVVGWDNRVVRFGSTGLTVAEFIRAIEEQTPLRHHFYGCGNAGSSILFGRNCAMGLGFHKPDR